jgi:hypothetical protein
VADFRVNDRRGQRRPESTPGATPSGLVVPTRSLSPGRAYTDDPVVAEMRRNRRVSAIRKRASGGAGIVSDTFTGGGGGGDLAFALGRPRDPMFYWRQNNLPFDISKDEEMAKLREFCRLLYLSHPIIASCIDIYAKYPLQGMSIKCKDNQLKEFYEDLFFEQLDYKKFMVDISREKWMVGEAFPLGTFNEILGVWESEELLHPNDVFVERSPISRDPRFLIKLPQALRDVLRNRQPVWEYQQLVESYPELVAYAGENSRMPVSAMLLKQIKFEADTFHKRGIPIIMRAFRAVLQEEMLNTAQDAISDRLYTPLLLAKLGATASDLGTDVPWIPTQDELDDFRESLDEALAADFRVMVHNFATTIENVFGKEEMPDLSGDFDRIEDRMLQTFGLSRTMLQGAAQGETYAADALNRDIVTQLMTDHQKQLKDFFRDRARIVAEAQEHFDYDVRNGKRYVKMEEVLLRDEETGEDRIVEQPKLLVPELEFDTLNLADQAQERQFIEALVATGVPIPQERRILGTGLDFEEMLEQKKQEQIRLAVLEQQTRKETYEALRDEGLPIPDDLKKDFQPVALNAQDPSEQDMVIPTMGTNDTPTPALAPSEEDLAEGEDEGADDTDSQAQVIPMPMAAQTPEEGDQRPPESDEQRASMPKPASRKVAGFRYRYGQIRHAIAAHYSPPDNSIEDVHDEETGTVIKRPENYRPTGLYGPPRHIGMRRYVEVDPGEKWKPEWDEEVG